MRIRNGFITNSSSSGFIINFNKLEIPTPIELYLLIKDNEVIKYLVKDSSISQMIDLLEKDGIFPIKLDNPEFELIYKSFDVPYQMTLYVGEFDLYIKFKRKSKDIVHFGPNEGENYIYWNEPDRDFNYYNPRFFYKFWDINIDLVWR